jgi:broad specificity phosphatase PhoE
MARALGQPWAGSLRAVWCSTERKARDGAEILAGELGLAVTKLEELGENDRSATGYLPRTAFEAMADLFFAHPEESVHGWERAVDAQSRIVVAVDRVLTKCAEGGDVAIVSDGGVGTLLLCHLSRCLISREHDQPANNGGNYYAFDVESRHVRHGWRPIDS